MASHGIEVKDLYKIFGPHGEKYIEAVRNGMSKADLNEKHGHVLGLKDINISMPAGKIQVVMGLSGSGKSTLIRHINRLIDPTAGSVHYEDVDVCQMSKSELLEFRRHKTAMVFQKFALLPHRTVIGNTVYGLKFRGSAKRRPEPARSSGLTALAFPALRTTIPTSYRRHAAACGPCPRPHK